MNNRDRAFLRDFAHFTCKNHLITAQGLLSGLADLNGVTARTIHYLHPEKPEQERSQIIAENNEAVRPQRVLIAKIFAEKVASLENLGAFALAIRDRNKPPKPEKPAPGIFRHYFESRDGVPNFYDDVIEQDVFNHPEITLATLLNLPSLLVLANHVSQSLLTGIQYDYEVYPKQLSSAADIYRTTFMVGTTEEAREALTEGWKNDVNIIVHVGDEISKKPALPTAYNKIKHRFMLTDLLTDYLDPALSDQEKVHYARLGMEEQGVHSLIADIADITKSMQELAALLIIFDEAGVSL